MLQGVQRLCDGAPQSQVRAFIQVDAIDRADRDVATRIKKPDAAVLGKVLQARSKSH